MSARLDLVSKRIDGIGVDEMGIDGIGIDRAIQVKPKAANASEKGRTG